MVAVMTEVAQNADEAAQAAVQAQGEWNSGQQAQAIERVRPFADRGDPWALWLIVWFMHQQGLPGAQSAVPYAEQAIQKGYQSPANFLVGNLMTDPTTRPKGVELMKELAVRGWPSDPLGHIQQVISSGDVTATAQYFELLGTEPFPLLPPDWDRVVTNANDKVKAIGAAEADVQSQRARVIQEFADSTSLVNAERAKVETQTAQLMQLINDLANAETTSFFDSEASSNQAEASRLWLGGIAVVSVAALLALVPLLATYFGWFDAELKGSSFLSAHLSAAVALGAVAGILLARSRGRDRTRQKAKDLSIALGTVFVYSGQISDESEQQKFKHDMARVVIESFLRQETPQDDSSKSLLAALVAR
jgi:hypothetical protein